MINTNEKELLDAIMAIKEEHGAKYVASIQEIEQKIKEQKEENDK